jgi:hypothetical protein
MRDTALNVLDAAMSASPAMVGRFAVARGLVKAGAWLLIVKPGSKEPVDLRNPREKASDEKAGRVGSGIYSSTNDVNRLERYWARAKDKFGQEPNVAIDVERSGLVVIDADQAAEVEAVQRLALRHLDLPPEAFPPTVTSPGVQKADGTWTHRGGGHFYFVRDLEVPAGKPFKLPGGAEVFTTGRYVLAPPSERAEGPYVTTGPVHNLSEAPWLVDLLLMKAADDETKAAQAERSQKRTRVPGEGKPASVESWNDARSWTDILLDYGWSPTPKPDACGCAIWTAPGDHASPKSATAHDAGCRNKYVDLKGGSGPLHIWTDNPPRELEGRDRWTKAQFVAAMRHESIREFVVTEGLVDDAVDPAAMTFTEDEEAAGGDSWDPVDLDAILDGSYEPPVATLMPRTDGLCLVYPGLVHSFHGESESGKSLVMQYATAEILKGGGDVLYLDYESDAASVVGRLQELGTDKADIRGHFTYIRPEAKPSQEKWDRLLARKFVLVVIDGVTDAFSTFGLDSNSNDDVTRWVRWIPKALADATGAGVVVIDHVTKDSGTRGRFAMGGQAKMSGLTGAAYIVDVLVPLGRGRRGELALRIAKDRPGSIRGQLPPTVEARKDRTEYAAHIVVDSTGGGIRVTVAPPDAFRSVGHVVQGNDGRHRYPDVMEKVSRRVELAGDHGMTRTAIKEAKAGNKDRVLAATDELVRLGYLVGKDGRDPHGHGVRLIAAEGRKPYRAADDPLLHAVPIPLDTDEDGLE